MTSGTDESHSRIYRLWKLNRQQFRYLIAGAFVFGGGLIMGELMSDGVVAGGIYILIALLGIAAYRGIDRSGGFDDD